MVKYLNFPCKLDLIADIQVDTEVQEFPHSWVKPTVSKINSSGGICK